jgi:hypothetical protein
VFGCWRHDRSERPVQNVDEGNGVEFVSLEVFRAGGDRACARSRFEVSSPQLGDGEDGVLAN